MANLLDALNQAAPAQSPGLTGETQKLAGMLRAKSGKAGVAPGLAMSSQAEKAAVAQTGQDMAQVQRAQTLQQTGQQQQAAAQEQQTGQQLKSVEMQRQQNQVQTQLRVNQTLQDLEQGRGKMDMARYKAGLEQVGQDLRLQNRQYVDNLQREGSRARLDNELQFKEQLARSVFDDNQNLLTKNMKNKSILNANDREFAQAMARMGASDAYAMFRSEMKGSKEAAKYGALSSLITTGIGAAANYKSSPTASDTKTVATGDITTGGAENIA